MKIIGMTDSGYLAEVNATELSIITGHGVYGTSPGSDRNKAFLKSTGREHYQGSEKIRPGTVIQITEGTRYANTVHEKTAAARKTAKELRELADMLEKAVPIVLQPEDPK